RVSPHTSRARVGATAPSLQEPDGRLAGGRRGRSLDLDPLSLRRGTPMVPLPGRGERAVLRPAGSSALCCWLLLLLPAVLRLGLRKPAEEPAEQTGEQGAED